MLVFFWPLLCDIICLLGYIFSDCKWRQPPVKTICRSLSLIIVSIIAPGFQFAFVFFKDGSCLKLLKRPRSKWSFESWQTKIDDNTLWLLICLKIRPETDSLTYILAIKNFKWIGLFIIMKCSGTLCDVEKLQREKLNCENPFWWFVPLKLLKCFHCYFITSLFRLIYLFTKII